MIDETLLRLREAAAHDHQEALKMLASFAPGEDSSGDPPPLPDRRAMREPAMLQALLNNDMNDVRRVLQEDPEAATEPFWDHEFEPPLVCAVRLHCQPVIVQLLLDHGASPDSTDIYGDSALQLVQKAGTMETNSLFPVAMPSAFMLQRPFVPTWHLNSESSQVNTQATWHSEIMSLFVDHVGVAIE